MRVIKTYSEMIRLPTFEERFEYLKCGGTIGVQTFGGHRYLNQALYRSYEWRKFRREVILRDNGFDLGCEGFLIDGCIYIHHINPITINDLLSRNSCVFDMENVISVSLQTHNALHYSEDCPRSNKPATRRPNDTCPWR